MEDRLLKWPEVAKITGLSRTTAWREVRADRFPKPVELTTRRIGWRHSDIVAWLEGRRERSTVA